MEAALRTPLALTRSLRPQTRGADATPLVSDAPSPRDEKRDPSTPARLDPGQHARFLELLGS
jgi:hypothetical protein